MKESTKTIVTTLIKRYPSLLVCEQQIMFALNILIVCYQQKRKLFTCGNGGSACDAQHIVGELMKAFTNPRQLTLEKQQQIITAFPSDSTYLISNLQRSLPAISLLGEIGLTSAYANDNAADLAFAQQILGLGYKGDVLFAISTSGNSKNILYACQVARIQGMKVIGLTGQTGGKIKELCDVTICVPDTVTYVIQEYHLPVYHAICLALEHEFFEECV